MIKTLQIGTLQAPGWFTDSNGNTLYFDGTQWYLYVAGEYYPMAITEQAPWKVVELAAGDTLRVEYEYYHEGPSQQVTEYVAVGYFTLGIFNEKTKIQKTKTLPLHTTSTKVTDWLGVIIPTSATPSWDSIHAKVMYGGILGEIGVTMEGCLSIVGVEADFLNFAITDYVKA